MRLFQKPIPKNVLASASNGKIDLGNGRVAVVVESHHASPSERWQMLRFLLSMSNDEDIEPISRRKRTRLNLMFLSTVLNPNCQACWYEVRDQ